MGDRFSLSWCMGSREEGKFIRDFLREKNISKSALTDIKFKGGSITVNGEETTVRYALRESDLLKVIFPEEVPSVGLKGELLPLEIIYEDESLLVINKPAEMNTIPSREHPCGSLANALIGYYDNAGIPSTTHIVTRLDRNTTGLVLVAKHRHVHHLLSLQQKYGQLRRVYEAFTEGWLAGAEGKVEEPIGRKETSIIEREVRPDGQYACTFYQVIERKKNFTWVELRLETGRTHQIRVHMSHLGHPLLGDGLYGGNNTHIKRQALHCKRLTFSHPLSEEILEFEVGLPTDMGRLL
ncbi:RluA family pseudouridine synthase [Mesobacillus harenae]|uniref:RluA family pseudouridine synthase n=1 Tax=Mesobacillus harenae TaxID=2213203 RepID=UPI0015812080|nr:RluA family pseudouridine synthase [Mesobacillus harenae]